MKRLLIVSVIALVLSLLGSTPLPASAASLSERLSGRILLQIQEKGKAWYLDPATDSRAYLGRPTDAFRVMRELGLGITTVDLEKISASDDTDSGDTKLARKLAGKILLQVQAKGEAWYINPVNLKRYYLGRPADAFAAMRGLGLGVSNTDIAKIPTTEKYTDPEQAVVTPTQAAQAEKTQKKGSDTDFTATKTEPDPSVSQTPQDLSAYAGSYRCWSYNVSGGGGGDCRLFAPIVLNKDGTYAVSSEKGTYSIKGDVITLSESKLRGPGTRLGGTQIRFEYDYNGWHHVITYLKEGGAASTTGAGNEIAVQVTLEYPTKDRALNSIVTLELVPEGQNVDTASYKPTAIAVWDGDKRVTASFHKELAKPRTGAKYTVYANTGFAATAVGTLDLTAATKDMTAVIKVTGSSTTQAEQKNVSLPKGPEIVVEIDLVYPTRDSSLGSIQSIVLVPEGEDAAVAVYKPTALAVWDGEKTVVGSFHKATNQVKTKARYTVYADWGAFGGYVKSGTLDLTATTSGPLTKKIQTTISGASSSGSSSSSNSSTSSQQASSSGNPSSSTSSSTPTTVSVNLILQYASGDSSLHNVTRIAMIKQGDTYYEGYSGEIAGYGASQQLTASFSYTVPGFLYDVYTESYTAGSKKVGTVDLRNATGNTAQTISVQ